MKGRTVPVKALAYFLLSNETPLELRYSALHNETNQRYVKLLLNKTKGFEKWKFPRLTILGAIAGKNTPQQLIDNQLYANEFVIQVLKELYTDNTIKAGPAATSDWGPCLELNDDGIPAKFLAEAENLNTLLSFNNGEGEKEILHYLSDPHVSFLVRLEDLLWQKLHILGKNLRYLLHVVGSKALYRSSWWEATQR